MRHFFTVAEIAEDVEGHPSDTGLLHRIDERFGGAAAAVALRPSARETRAMLLVENEERKLFGSAASCPSKLQPSQFGGRASLRRIARFVDRRLKEGTITEEHLVRAFARQHNGDEFPRLLR